MIMGAGATDVFLFRLALMLGIPDPGTLGKYPSGLIDSWSEYYSTEPFGPVIASWNAANIAAVIANVFSGRRSRRFRAADFMPEIRTSVGHNPGDMYRSFREWAIGAGAKDPRVN